jgi:hypothetical protein
MPFAKIYPEAMTVSALRDSVATHSVVVKNAPVDHVFVNPLINLWNRNAVWQGVPLTRIVQLMPSVSKSLEVSVTAPALQDTNQVQMEAVRMLMNVVKVCSGLVGLVLCVKTNLDHFLAHAHPEAQETPTTVSARQSEINALLTISVEKMKNA